MTLKKMDITIKISNVRKDCKMNGYLSGNIIREVLAGRYLRENNIQCDIEQDETFNELFWKNLRFGFATPVYSGNKARNTAAFFLPLSLLKSKETDSLIDVICEQYIVGYKSIRGMGWIYKNEIIPIDDWQIFQAEIIGTTDDLNMLRKMMNLGDKSCCVEYIDYLTNMQNGQYDITFGNIADLPANDETEHMYVRLDSPLLVRDNETQDARVILQKYVVNPLKEKISQQIILNQVVSDRIEIDIYVSEWGTFCPRQFGLAAGTVFELQKNGIWNNADMEVLVELGYAGIGCHKQDGYGQFRVWKHDRLQFRGRKNLNMGNQSIKTMR